MDAANWIIRYRATNGWEFKSKRIASQSDAVRQAWHNCEAENLTVLAIEGPSRLEGAALRAALEASRQALRV